eukprot:1332092-Prymnesium_polylepis.1
MCATPQTAARGAKHAPRRTAAPPPAKKIFTFSGFAGTTGGSFFASPGWVDKSKPPGTTSQDA